MAKKSEECTKAKLKRALLEMTLERDALLERNRELRRGIRKAITLLEDNGIIEKRHSPVGAMAALTALASLGMQTYPTGGR